MLCTGGFYLLRKLFDTGSSITIEEFSFITDQWTLYLLKLGPDFAIVKCGDYRIEASGEDLIVETLSEEVAVFAFTSITTLERQINDGWRYLMHKRYDIKVHRQRRTSRALSQNSF